MARTKPPVLRLGELVADQVADSFVLLVEKKHGVTSQGKPFYSCRLRDGTRVVTAMIWSDDALYNPCHHEWHVGQFFKVRGLAQFHEKYGHQLKLEKARRAEESDRTDGFDPALLTEHSRFPSGEMLAELRTLVEQSIADVPLRRLVLGLLEKHAPALERLPASIDRYFPFAGGLLEHTLSVTKNCLWLAQRYKGYYADMKATLNVDLIVAGAVLHEIGRVRELEAQDALSQPTVPGRLFGHLILGRDLVRDAARDQGDVNPELLQLLEHLLLSYLTLPEWGSPRLPLVPECIILHHADDLDCKLEMYVRCLDRDDAPGPFTERDPMLGKQLLKSRSV